MTDETSGNTGTRSRVVGVVFILASAAVMSGQGVNPLGYSVATPRPISPADGTTTPSAQATQRQNPYLGSVPSKRTHRNENRPVPKGRYRKGAFATTSGWSKPIRRVPMYGLSECGLYRPSCRNCPRMPDRVTKASAIREIGLKLPPIPGLPALPPHERRLRIPGCPHQPRAISL